MRKNGIPLICAALLCIFFSLLVLSCPNPAQPGKRKSAIPAGKGALTLLVAGEKNGRAITPSKPAPDIYELRFTPIAESTGTEETVTRSAADLPQPILLEVGTYNLEILAYRSDKPVARGELTGIVITEGNSAKHEITLSAIVSGGGTFRWELDFPATVTGALMLIQPRNSGGTEKTIDLRQAGMKTSSTELNGGYYQVIIELTRTDHQTIEHLEILHIYQNLESFLTIKFDDDYFNRNRYTITYKYNDDGITEDLKETVMHGNTLSPPDSVREFILEPGLYLNPLPEEWQFDGWYRDNGSKWNFDTTVIGDMTLTAQWSFTESIQEIDLSGTAGANIVAKAAAYVNANAASAGYTLLMGANLTLAAEIDLNAGAVLTITSASGGPFTITRGYERSDYEYVYTGLFMVNNGAKLELQNIVIDGNKGTYNNNVQPLVLVKGEFTLGKGAVLRNNTTGGNYYGRGSGALVVGGIFTMTGGEISGNTARDGGALNIGGDTAVFTMTGGSISGNTATNMGGGIYVDEYATFTMTGGEISGNTARAGGGVYTNTAINVLIGGTAVIRKNTAELGGGVYAGSEPFNVGGSAVISENTVTSTGAASNVRLHGTYYGDQMYITIGTGSNAPAAGMSIGVQLVTAGGVIVQSGANASHVQYFRADEQGKVVELRGAQLVIGGPGTEGNPRLVANEADLRKVGTGIDGWTLGDHYRQTANITIDYTKPNNWTVIGSNSNDNAFFGSYNGGGYTITGLTIAAATEYQGMFAYIAVIGKVENLGLVDVAIDGTGTYTGGIAGGSHGTIQNCYVTGVVTSERSGNTATYTGGIAGYNYGTIQNCYVAASVYGTSDIGGITGSLGSYGGIRNCVALNTLIQGTNISGRISGSTGGTRRNNYAWAGVAMTYYNNGATITPSAATLTGKDGENVIMDGLKDNAWWTAAGRWSADEIGAWDFTNVWVLNGATGMPSLKNSAVLPWPDAVETLAQKLAWLSVENNVQSGQTYTINVTADEAIGLQAFSYSNRSNVTIVLRSSGAERIVSSSGNNNLFNIGNGVTLVLDNNITLRGSSGSNILNALVFANTGGTVIMNTGAKITGHTATYGGGVIVYGTFIMNGGTISGNTDTNGGGGVRVERETALFTMNGGEISGNRSNSSSNGGGGVSVTYNGTFIMNGGTISGNTAPVGSGVSVNSGTFTVGGTSVISGNTVSSTDTTPSNVYLSSGIYLTFGMGSNAPAPGMNIGIRTATTDGVIVQSGANATIAGYFHPDEAGKSVVLEGGQLFVKLLTGEALQNLIDNAANGATVTVPAGTYSVSSAVKAEKNVTLTTGNNQTVRLERAASATDDNLLEVNGGGSLTLRTGTGGSLVIDGRKNGSGGALIAVNNGTLTMANDGVSIQNNNGNGVSVAASGELVISGGEISGNEVSSGAGGGVFVEHGTLTMSGGKITGNKAPPQTLPSGANASGRGGGVCLFGGTFTMTGGEISGNQVPAGNGPSGGGGVATTAQAVFIMSGGTISNNETDTSGSGGGVNIGSGSFTMSANAIITGNKSGYGGGVIVQSGSFIMQGGTITDNEANATGGTYGGGGVYVVNNAAFTMSGGTISNNRAVNNGGGLLINENGTFRKTGGTIYGSGEGANSNTAGAQGQAIAINQNNTNILLRQRDTTVGATVRLYFYANSTIDPDDSFDTDVNWTD